MTVITDERRARLAASINKLHAYHEIQNEMGRLLVACNFHQPEKVLTRFALDRPDVWMELADEGVFTGREAVMAIVDQVFGKPQKPGEMLDMHLTTPIIEVADDLESARAVWICPGAGATLSEDGEPKAIWVWGTIAADFVPEGETWKVWHLHYFRYIKCDYHKGWVEDTSMINRPNTPMHPLSSETTYHNPFHPLSIRDGIPPAPRPYNTYDGSAWMLNRDKSR